MLNTIASVNVNTLARRYPVAVNIICFQIGWFSCVLMAAQGEPLAGALVAVILTIYAILTAKHAQTTLVTILTVSTLGVVWDSALTNFGILLFNTGVLWEFLAPYWIITMWLLFSTTLNVSLRWLYHRYLLAALLGLIFGPLAYLGGAALGAVEIPDRLLASIVMAAGWAIIFPVSLLIAEFLEQSHSKLE